MSENFEQKNEQPAAKDSMADFGSHDQFDNKHYEAAKMLAQATRDDLSKVDLEDRAKSGDGTQRKEFPHSWYQSANACYGLPGEAALSSVKPLLVHGWNKLHS